VADAALTDSGFYVVQPGDTLAQLAARFGTTIDEFVALNNLAGPDVLEVGQTLQVPGRSLDHASSFKIVPDSEIVYGPTTIGFDVAAYAKIKSGFFRVHSQQLGEEYYSGVELLSQVALDYSVNPRILLALLEYQAGWLSEMNPSEEQKLYPMGIVDANRQNLYSQLLRTANVLNEGYYNWRYRGMESMLLADGSAIIFSPQLNAGTVAIQYFFGLISGRAEWELHVSEQGFFQTYLSLFGDPFRSALDPVVPYNLSQPTLTLPFASGETWYYTGGPHGGYNSGSAWSSVDFAPPAPPDDLLAREGFCYVSPNWVTAVAPGIVARSGGGYVVLDLDFDGNEHTGWNIVYLHVSSREVIAEGTRVSTGDRLGHPSCEGGFSQATHLHIGRRYNGEWIPANCLQCTPDVQVPSFVMSDWEVYGYVGQEYQGGMRKKGAEDRLAEQGRDNPLNQVRY
jgi:murein DD-endopeptidase MepM/ murein hydrolase activator NlpD